MRKNGTVLTMDHLAADCAWIVDAQPLSMTISDIMPVLKKNGWEVSRNSVFVALRALGNTGDLGWDVSDDGQWVFYSKQWVYHGKR